MNSQQDHKKVHVLKLHLNNTSKKTIQIKLPKNIDNSDNLEQLIDGIVEKYRLKKEAKFYIWDHISNKLGSSANLNNDNFQMTDSDNLCKQIGRNIKNKRKNNHTSLEQLGFDFNRIKTQVTPNNNEKSTNFFKPSNKKQQKKVKNKSTNPNKSKLIQDSQSSLSKLLSTGMSEFSQLFSSTMMGSKNFKENNLPKKPQKRMKTQSSLLEEKFEKFKFLKNKKQISQKMYLKTQPAEDYKEQKEQPQQTKYEFQDFQENIQQKREIILNNFDKVDSCQNINTPTPCFQSHPNLKKQDLMGNLRVFSFEDLQEQTKRQIKSIKFQRKIQKFYPELSALFLTIKPQLCEFVKDQQFNFSLVNPQINQILSEILSKIEESQLKSMDLNEFLAYVKYNENQAQELFDLLK